MTTTTAVAAVRKEAPQERLIFFNQALREAIDEEMQRDPAVFVIGEEVGIWGGAYKVTEGLLEKYGESRIIDTPISEALIAGAAVEPRLPECGPSPNSCTATSWASPWTRSSTRRPRTATCSGARRHCPSSIARQLALESGNAAQHTQSLEAWFTHVPGLKVVSPSTPYDAKGLLKSAIRDNNVVVFLEHKALYASRGNVPEGDYVVPLGTSDVKRVGAHATIVTYSRQVAFALEAAERLAQEGVEVEVIDLRTLYPMDIGTAVASVQKTNRALVVHEAVQFGGFGGEIASQIQQQAFDYLDAPVERLGALHSPVPFSEPLEFGSFPSVDRIVDAVRDLIVGA